MRILQLAALLCVATLTIAQEPEDIRFIGRPDMAVRLAAKDVQTLQATDPAAAAAAWYIWIRDSEDSELADVYDWILNYGTSRAEVGLRTTRINGGTSGILLRLDRREWFPTVETQSNFVDIVEEYIDPTFYDVTQQFVGEEKTKTIKRNKLVDSEPYLHEDGNVYKKKWVSETVEVPVVDHAGFHPAVLAMAGEESNILKEVTGLNVPIVEAERWLVYSLRTLDGGLYYRLQGYRDKTGKGLTQDQWLALFGASEQDSEKANAEEFIGLWRSNVTGKSRRAKFLMGRLVRPSVGSALVVVTQDGADGDNKTNQHPLYSLFDFEFAATEILAMRPNGTIAFSLFDSAGNLQDSAPDNIVHDHTIPEPNTSRLECAISCMRCHGPETMWKPMPNQVKTLLSNNFAGDKRLRVFTDLNDESRTQEEVLHALKTRYSGDLTLPLQLARDAVEFSTARMVDFKLEESGYAIEAAARMTRRFNAYVYEPVTPVEALRTLGMVVDPKNATKVLEGLNPIGKPGATVFADPAFVTLLMHEADNNLVVTRPDWERIYAAVLGTALESGEIENVVDVKPPVADLPAVIAGPDATEPADGGGGEPGPGVQPE